MGQNSLTPEENNGLNFQLTCDQATNLETAANFCASHSHANDFFQILFYFGLGGIGKVKSAYEPSGPSGWSLSQFL